MNLNEQRYRYRALDAWFKTPQGSALADAFSNQLSQFKQHLKLDILLQLGGAGSNNWLAYHRFKHVFVSTPCFDTEKINLIASPTALPLERNCIDVVIAPFILEVFGRDESPLDEIDRVLNPMGHVIFFGINPLSLWGLSLACHGLEGLGQTRMFAHSPWWLKRAFLNRGYQQKRFEMFHYLPPFKRKSWIKSSVFFNEMGKIMPVFPAGFYCLVLQKYETLPVRPENQFNLTPLIKA